VALLVRLITFMGPTLDNKVLCYSLIGNHVIEFPLSSSNKSCHSHVFGSFSMTFGFSLLLLCHALLEFTSFDNAYYGDFGSFKTSCIYLNIVSWNVSWTVDFCSVVRSCDISSSPWLQREGSMWLDLVTYLHHHGYEEKVPWYRGKVHIVHIASW
jgi:hypothetical protein